MEGCLNFKITKVFFLSWNDSNCWFLYQMTLITHFVGNIESGCNSDEPESYRHLFFRCSKNCTAGQALLRVIRCYDANILEENSLRLELSAVDPFLLPSVAILATGLEFIWERRKMKKSTTNSQIRAELEFGVSIRRKSRSRIIKESATIMDNMITNFFEQLL